MVIHHDKMAYGKIKPLQDEVDKSRLAAMLKQLSSAEEGQSGNAAPANSAKEAEKEAEEK